jgi:DNA excision repair protein ERCC-4
LYVHELPAGDGIKQDFIAEDKGACPDEAGEIFTGPMLLEYEREILRESNGENVLLIMAGGLSTRKIMSLNVQFYLNRSSLAFLLNLNDDDRESLLRLESPFLREVSSIPRSRRGELYGLGGVFIASSRVMIADMIDGTINIGRISCLIINNVETIRDASTEAFILHLFRDRNKTGLIKSFCDSPIPLSYGYMPLERKMRCLRVDRILFYPRFHKSVERSLDADVELNEIRFRLTRSMSQMQIILLEILDSLLRSIPGRDERGEISSEAILFSSFYCILRNYGVNNGRVMEDIRNIKMLVSFLYSADPMSFYTLARRLYQEQIGLEKEGTWINLTISHVLLEKAKEACNKVKPPEDGEEMNEGGANDRLQEGMSESLSEDSSCKRPRISEGCDPPFSSLSVEEARRMYNTNPKIEKLVELLQKTKRTVVLASSQLIKEYLIGALACFELVEDRIRVLTHYEFKYFESEYDEAVFVDPCQASVRKIETYGKQAHVRVHFLIYADSLEEQKHLNEIRNEKQAFERLIEERARLPLALGLENEVIDLEETEDAEREYVIVVDVRELRSDLPYFLFRAGNRICISTLTTGDYLLGPQTCIERKTVPDFVSSLNNGRLYSQMSMLCHRYSKPYLLLEFDGRPSLSDHYSHNQDTFRNSILARLCLLLLSFSRMRIIWSDSGLFTTRVIRDMQRREEQDPEVEGDALDPVLQEILLSIPGINQLNLRRVVGGFGSLRELLLASKGQLEDVVSAESAELIYNFFRRRLPSPTAE